MGTVFIVTRPQPITWLRDHQRAADGLPAGFITAAAVTFHVLDLATDGEAVLAASESGLVAPATS